MNSTAEFLIGNWMLIAAALVSGGLLLWPSLRRGAQGQGVSPNEAVQLINREKAAVIDVCEPEEFAQGHVVGSRNLPVGSLETAKGLPGNKTLPVLLVCASGARAARAAGVLQKMGYENTRVLHGGLKAWREAGLPVEVAA